MGPGRTGSATAIATSAADAGWAGRPRRSEQRQVAAGQVLVVVRGSSMPKRPAQRVTSPSVFDGTSRRPSGYRSRVSDAEGRQSGDRGHVAEFFFLMLRRPPRSTPLYL